MSGGKSGISGDNEKRWGDTTSKKGEVSRVFVGNIDSHRTTCADLQEKFSRYGQLNGIDVHNNGFAFVQFENVDEAKEACENETQTMLHNRRVEVRMFDKKGKSTGNNSAQNFGRNFRDRSPIRQNRHPGGGIGFNNSMNNMNNNNGPEPFISGFHPQSQQQPQSNFQSVPNLAICPPAPPGHVSAAGNNFVPGGLNVPPGAMNHTEEQANEIEIIVINKDQWRYAEMIEQKIRQETGIRLIDILFLHAPQHIAMTLNDLFERRTLYALVVAPEDEIHKSVTIHVLHNQMEYPNLPLDKAMAVIADDYRKNGPPIPIRDPGFPHRSDVDRNGSFTGTGFPPIPSASSHQHQQQPHLTSSSASQDKRLPDDVSALLRITIQEGGVQFLSLAQIDTIIEFFTRERDRLTATPQRANISLNSYGHSSQTQQQQQPPPHSLNAGASAGASGSGYLNAGPPPALGQSLGSDSMISGGAKNINDLVNMPQVKQALNSLLTLGAIGSNQQGQSSQSAAHPYGDMGNSANSGSVNNDRQQQQFSHYAAGNAIRRHPLAGSDVSRPPAGGHEQQEQDQVNEDQRLQYYEYQQQQHQNFLQRYESPVSEEFDPRRFQSLERAKWYF